MRLLLFNLATDLDDPILGFTTCWIRALAKRVEYIHVVTMRAGRVEVPDNVSVYSVGKEKSYGKPRRLGQFYWHLLRVLREDHIAICFSHMMPLFTLLAAPVLRAKGIPIITWYAHLNLTWILRLAHHLSHRMVTSLATAYPYKQDKLIAVGQGIDTDLFSPDGNVSSEDPPMILCVGRLSPVKDHPTLLKAVMLLRQHWNKPFRVVIVGGPATVRDEYYVQSLRAQVKELALEDIVCFKPPVSMADLPSWYRRCTVHVNLTPTGSGDKVIWEAMACGKPCVLANEGFKETLGQYADRLLFRYGDPEELSQKIEWILEGSSTDRQITGADLRQNVAFPHGLERLAERLVDLFAEVVCRQ